MRGNPEQSGNANILLYNINNIYNIIFPTVEKTWRKMCNIRVQNHGVLQWFRNVSSTT